MITEPDEKTTLPTKRIMKVIFLDIDGVLNSEDWFCSTFCERRANKGGFPDSHLDPSAIERVNHLCKITGAKIVLSTTWRDMDDIEGILYRNGLRADIIGITPFSDRKLPSGLWTRDIRGKEIQRWLDKNDVEAYAILDDDTDMLPEQKPYFINTDVKHGLNAEKANKAIEILSNA